MQCLCEYKISSGPCYHRIWLYLQIKSKSYEITLHKPIKFMSWMAIHVLNEITLKIIHVQGDSGENTTNSSSEEIDHVRKDPWTDWWTSFNISCSWIFIWWKQLQGHQQATYGLVQCGGLQHSQFSKKKISLNFPIVALYKILLHKWPGCAMARPICKLL